MTQRDVSPNFTNLASASKYFPPTKYTERAENRAKEEVHRRLSKGELEINKENSQKRLIAALLQPKL